MLYEVSTIYVFILDFHEVVVASLTSNLIVGGSNPTIDKLFPPQIAVFEFKLENTGTKPSYIVTSAPCSELTFYQKTNLAGIYRYQGFLHDKDK
jgi:hypothetical protein